MTFRALAFLTGLLCAQEIPVPAAPPTEPGAQVGAGPNVILVMWDGIRWQEFLGNRPDPALAAGDQAEVFPRFWSALSAQGAVYGDESLGSRMSVSNPATLSLPGYQSIMAGSTQPCFSNDCPRIGVETFPQRLVRELGLPPAKVATVANWVKMALAVEKSTGTTYVDAGAGGVSRPDAPTWAAALDLLRGERPRFLFISLGEADDLGHAGDYPGYLAALRRYDRWLEELIGVVDGMGDYGKRTTILLTTDHGRGVGADWKSHGWRPWAGRVWLYARGPGVRGVGRLGKGPAHSHADIRPTVESLLGLKPFACSGCGEALPEVVGP